MNPVYLDRLVDLALQEDLGFQESPDSWILKGLQGNGSICFQEPGVIAGLFLARKIFERVDSTVLFNELKKDGEQAEKGEQIAHVSGSMASIFTAERIALNFMQHLSGIATRTNRVVSKLPESVRLLDTRKTIPGMRALQKWAVRLGGGSNHRFNLTDLIMIKRNHIRVHGSITGAVSETKKRIGNRLMVEVETGSIEQFREALETEADIIMLDNFTPEMVKEAVALRSSGKPLLEVSGGIDEKTVTDYAHLGIDLISMGSLTHSVCALSIHLVAEEA